MLGRQLVDYRFGWYLFVGLPLLTVFFIDTCMHTASVDDVYNRTLWN
jgi:hypothetical protein